MDSSILEQLDSDLYLSGAGVDPRFSKDWGEERECMPPVVLRPRNTDDVSRMLSLCQAGRQSLVTQGGLTGLCSGAVPLPGEWAMNLERLNGIVELDRQSMTITVRAGTPLQQVQDAATDAGLVFPLDMGSRGSCTAGGIVATNAGGNQVIQHGMARSLVLGLEVVLADGSIISNRNKLLKNNAGLDLKQLFIGSEGVLGVVTEVTFRLFPRKAVIQTALCALSGFDQVVALLQKMGRRLNTIKAFEVMWPGYFADACEATGQASPFDKASGFYVLIETEGPDEASAKELFEWALERCLDEDVVNDVIIAQNLAESRRFWQIRDGVAELIPRKGPFAHLDIGIPISEMEAFSRDVESALDDAFEDGTTYIFGHVGDSNLHVLAAAETDAEKSRVYDIVYNLTGRFDGSISAEHGVGTSTKNWLHLSRSKQEVELMKLLKASLDPAGILNPHRIFD